MVKVIIIVVMLMALSTVGCSKEPVPELSDEYLVGFPYGGSSWGEFYDCIDAEVIICTNHDVLISMPTAETVGDEKHRVYEQVATLTLTDSQYSAIEKAVDREKLYNLDVEAGEADDGYSLYLFLYNKDNSVAKMVGAYMPEDEDFIEIYETVMDNLPRQEIDRIRDENVERLRLLRRGHN